jgi:uncharacterized protein DUF3800
MYIDESYGKPSPNIVIAGFISHIDLWAQFAQAWQREITERYRIPFLHATELWNPNATVYKHLTRQQHDEIFLTAKSLICDHALMGVACVINQSEFNEISTSAQRSKFGTDYTIGVRLCVTDISEYCASLPGRPTISMFLENGHRNTSQAINLLKQARQTHQQAFDSILRSKDRFIVWRDPARDSLGFDIGVIDTGTKANSAPLQAADLLAFSILNDHEIRFQDTLNEFGSSFPVLINYMSRGDLGEILLVLDKEETNRRQQRRRYASVIREMKNSARDVEKHNTGGYFVNFDDLAEAENRVINRFGEETSTRLLNKGDATKPPSIDTEIDVQCANCKTLFTLRGFSRHQSFGCPICLERIPLPEIERYDR